MSETIPYNLSIRITADGFSFMLKQEDGKTLLQRKTDCLPTELPERIRQEALSQNLAKRPFMNVQTILHTPFVHLVPTELYREEDRWKWLAFGHDTQITKQSLHTDSLPVYNCHTIYSIPTATEQTLQELFPNARYFHILSYLLLHNENQQPATRLHAYQEPHALNVVAIKNNRLLLANRYPTQNDTDAAYWLLNIVEQLELQISDDAIYLQPESATGLKNLLHDVMKY